MRAALASPWFGNLETWAQSQPFDKCLSDTSVYEGFGLIEAPVLKAAGLNYTIKVGTTIMGVDKLSHFMTEGYDYYKTEKRGETLNQILNIGTEEEEDAYGFRATGIKSYADMTANYFGYQFWKNMIDGPNPYIKCENGKWIQNRKFDWNDYVNPMFDEAINCSKYKNDGMQAIVDNNVEVLQREHSQEQLGCPVDLKACSELNKWVPDLYVRSQIVHPRCIAVPKVDGPSEKGGQINRGSESDITW